MGPSNSTSKNTPKELKAGPGREYAPPCSLQRDLNRDVVHLTMEGNCDMCHSVDESEDHMLSEVSCF